MPAAAATVETANRTNHEIVFNRASPCHTIQLESSGGAIIESHPKKDWVNIAFLTLTPVIGIAGTAATPGTPGFISGCRSWPSDCTWRVGLSICAGYHRFFSHKSYEASPVGSGPSSRSSGPSPHRTRFSGGRRAHRVHHKYADKDWDPYNIRRGFWWAHILWIFHRNERAATIRSTNAPDLLANPIVMWQHRWHKVILIVGGFGLPTLIGAAFGDPIAGLLWGGFTRIVVVHHTTFFVNSLAHYARSSGVQCRGVGTRQLAGGAGYPRRGVSLVPPSLSRRFPQRHPLVSVGSGEVVHLRAPRCRPGQGLLATPLPQIEQARMRAAIRVVETKMALANSSIADEARRRLAVATNHLERAIALWRRAIDERAQGIAWRRTRKMSHRHVSRSRRHWKWAVRALQAA